jgi:hypothetical protein
LASVLTTLAALSTLLPALAGLVLTALLLLAGLRLPTAALLWVALVLLLVATRFVLAWIVRHWTFSSHFEGLRETLPARWFNARRGVLFLLQLAELHPID